MDAVEQDLALHEMRQDAEFLSEAVEEAAAKELREELLNSTTDMEFVLQQAMESDSLPLSHVAEMLVELNKPSSGEHTQTVTDSCITELRNAIEPHVKQLISERVPGRIEYRRTCSEVDQADSRWS